MRRAGVARSTRHDPAEGPAGHELEIDMAAGVVRALARIDRCRPAADGGLGDVLEPVVRPPELLLESVARQHPEERSDDLARKLVLEGDAELALGTARL